MQFLDPTGWLFYCPICDGKTDARLAEERDALSGEEYFELVCTFCASVLLTAERATIGVTDAETTRAE